MNQEKVLVVPASSIPAPIAPFTQNAEALSELFSAAEPSFLERGKAENDPSFKQIIPYIALATHDQRVLVYERAKSSGEDRLHHKLSIGIGGHINEQDGEAGLPAFMNGAQRELVEEIGLALPHQVVLSSVVGLINDESDEVGMVHLGVAMVLLCTNERAEDILTKCESHMLEPRLISVADLEQPEIYDNLESWSKHLAAFFVQRAGETAKWNDAAFRERMGFLAVSAGNLASAASGFLLQESPRSHVLSRQMVEQAAGETQCMIAGAIHNDDISQENVIGAANAFRDELQNMLKHQS